MEILGLMVGYDVKKIVRTCKVAHSWNRWVVRSWSESKGEFKWRVKLQGTKEVVWLGCKGGGGCNPRSFHEESYLTQQGGNGKAIK